ncbi:MAG: agmatinase, partial [Endomicrobiia bacterium]
MLQKANNKFLGLPDAYSSYDKSKVVIQPIPFEKTTSYGHCTYKGPKAIIDASFQLELYDIETNSE